MRSHKKNNQRKFRLELLEGRNAPSHGGLVMSGAGAILDLRHEHHGGQPAQVQMDHGHNQRGRHDNGTPGRDQNDVADNEVNDVPGAPEPEPNDVANHDVNDTSGSHGRGH